MRFSKLPTMNSDSQPSFSNSQYTLLQEKIGCSLFYDGEGLRPKSAPCLQYYNTNIVIHIIIGMFNGNPMIGPTTIFIISRILTKIFSIMLAPSTFYWPSETGTHLVYFAKGEPRNVEYGKVFLWKCNIWVLRTRKLADAKNFIHSIFLN